MPPAPARPVLDASDARILQALQPDPRATAVAIARAWGLGRRAGQLRLARVEELGVLGMEGAPRVPLLLGLEVAAYVRVEVHQRDFARMVDELRRIPEV